MNLLILGRYLHFKETSLGCLIKEYPLDGDDGLFARMLLTFLGAFQKSNSSFTSVTSYCFHRCPIHYEGEPWWQDWGTFHILLLKSVFLKSEEVAPCSCSSHLGIGKTQRMFCRITTECCPALLFSLVLSWAQSRFISTFMMKIGQLCWNPTSHSMLKCNRAWSSNASSVSLTGMIKPRNQWHIGLKLLLLELL